MSVLFVCGVHGCGKTTFCAALARELEVQAFSSSSLIREEKQNAISDVDKRVKNIEGNQQLLVLAVRKKVNQNTRIILDGHMTLLNVHGEVTRLGAPLFADLGVSRIILLNTPPAEICTRLLERDGKVLDSKNILAHMELEEVEAKNVAETLDIPFHIFNYGKDGVELLAKQITAG